MIFKEDNTYNNIRERSMTKWLEEVRDSEDIVNRGGAKLTLEYLQTLQRKISELEEKNRMKDDFLRRLKEENRKLTQEKSE